MAQRVSIFTVAQRAKCSVASVSNVLNNKGRVGPQKRKAILHAVEALGYQVSSAARNLRIRKSEMLGLLLYPSRACIFKNPYYTEIMEGLEEGLMQQSYHLLLADFQTSEAPNGAIGCLAQRKVDGMIMLGHFPAKIVENLCAVCSPLLLLGFNTEWPVDSVISDGFSAEVEVVNQLVRRGHHHIVMAAYGTEDRNFDLRVQGFLAGMAKAGLPGVGQNVMREGLSEEDIYRSLLLRLREPNPPTAVVAINDTLALAIIKRLQEDGYRIPEQISIVGYGDDVLMSEPDSFLSTVRVNKRRLGRIGAEVILNRVREPDAPVVRLRLPAEFIPRESLSRIVPGNGAN